MNRERLSILARKLDNWPRKQFDMGVWKCGTVACAGGIAASEIPSFQRDGLSLRKVEEDEYEPVFGDYRAFSALKAFFDLEYYEADELFSTASSLSTTPKQVAKRIRALMESER